ncbi:MAG: hypothetical protein K0T53_01705 [Wolbachia pipientis]|nr:hypothetical protein [Wolbachia pipientis]
MTSIQEGNSNLLIKSLSQVINGKIIFKDKHRVIYDAFMQSLKNALQSGKLKENDKTILAFMLDQNQVLFKNVKLRNMKLLSEENFLQFLLSMLEKIRKKKLVDRENLRNNEIEKIINECISDIYNTEAKDSLISFIGRLFGIKVNPKNIFGSLKKELLPFFSKSKEENDELPFSDEKMVIIFLYKLFLPIILFACSILIFSMSPMISIVNGIFLILSISGAVKSIFSNDKKGTLYHPYLLNEKEWSEKISNGISEILETQIKENKYFVQSRKNSKQFILPEQIQIKQNQFFQERKDEWQRH